MPQVIKMFDTGAEAKPLPVRTGWQQVLDWLRHAARARFWLSFQAGANPRSRPIFQLYRTRPDFWTVIRPGGRMEHGFPELGEAVSFIRAESRGLPVTVELRIDDFYAVSYLEPGREGPLFGETA
jgi:hypothetical protein